jgi:Resolvase, N terminal domain
MINFCPPGTPNTARRALENVLQSRRVYQSRRRPFFYSPRCDHALPRYLRRPRQPAGSGAGRADRGADRLRPGQHHRQLLDRQQHALTEAGCLRIFADKLSGKDADRPELAACLDYLRPGDTLVVPSLDRLSRSLADLIAIVTTLRRHGVGFKSLHEALDTTAPGGRLSSTSSPPWPSSSAS